MSQIWRATCKHMFCRRSLRFRTQTHVAAEPLLRTFQIETFLFNWQAVESDSARSTVWIRRFWGGSSLRSMVRSLRLFLV